jgi:hypothetical protein
MDRAFGTPLTVHRYAGSVITLHMGRPTAEEGPSPQSHEYLEELASLEQLGEQGDGIRAFMGILLTLTATPFPIVLIDEPEAYLHPPQAELLGRLLVEKHGDGMQVVLATHSADVVRGITSADRGRGTVSVVRLTRRGNENHVSQLSTDAVAGMYSDPLVRYHSILDGLFYHGVILCEGASDCIYYTAVYDSLVELDKGKKAESLSLHFTHCGGKNRLFKAVNALRSASVPVLCIVDFDWLRNDRDFERLASAYGGDAGTLTSLRSTILPVITARHTMPERRAVRSAAKAILDGSPGRWLTEDEVERLRLVARGESGWGLAKNMGRQLLSTNAEALNSFDELNSRLRRLGIFVVENGALESFHPNVPSDNKEAWLQKVLEDQEYLQTEGDRPREFVKAAALKIAEQQ